MTVAEWLAGRDPAAPGQLAERLNAVLGTVLEADAERAPELFISTAESLLTRMLAEGSSNRASAIDLLTVDALITYAFEAAGESGVPIDRLADDAMRRMAALGSGDR